MTSISYCSLEEAWGEPLKNENNDDNPISYSGGNQAGSELHPIFNSNNERINQNNAEPINNYELPVNNQLTNIAQPSFKSNLVQPQNQGSTVSNALVRLDDVNKDQLWNEFIKFLQEKNNKNNDVAVQENFSNLKSIGADNSYIDLLILILFGIVIIFIMDSFVRLGKKMKD